MASRTRLARVAVVRGEFALLVLHDAAADGEITGHELPTVIDAVEDFLQATRATDTAQALCHAIERGVGGEDPRYFNGLVSGYLQVVDEVDPAA